MRTIPIISLSVVFAIAAPGNARAQWGWGGWGSTVQGDIARGAGLFNAGVGQRNLSDAQAMSINADTAIRWNQALWESQHALNQSNYLRRQRRQATINKAQAEIYDRLRNHPDMHDIQNGDALNVCLDILVNPAASGSAFRTIRAPMSREVIQDIPFEYASEAVTICLDQITGKDGWPLALRDDAFDADHRALQKAIQEALDEDQMGNLRPRTIAAVSTAIANLDRHFRANVPTTSPDYIAARDYIKTLNGLTRMLHSPRVDEVLAELEKYQGTTVGDLLAFMQAFNLRFAPALSFRQRQIYQKLYPMLADQVNGPFANVAQNVDQGAKSVMEKAENAANNLGNAASALFKDKGSAPAPPEPKPQ
jgi:hypothetical protein